MKYKKLNKLSVLKAHREILDNIEHVRDGIEVKYSLSGLIRYLLDRYTPSSTCHKLFETYGYLYKKEKNEK